MLVISYFAAAALIAGIIIFAYTRCMRSTALVIVCSVVAVVWQLGIVTTLGFELDPYSILVPFLVFAIGVSHGVQKMNGIMQDVGRGTHRLVAARYTFRRLFLAGMTALLADAVGFAVLMMIDIPVIKDLATDMDPFFEKWVAAEAVHHPTASRHDPIPQVDPDENTRVVASEGIECINCAVCYASCDTVAGNSDYLGPAALQRAWTLVNDVKNSDTTTILEAVSGSGGCHNCHSQGSCAHYCPNELNPMKAIAGLKRATVTSMFKGR